MNTNKQQQSENIGTQIQPQDIFSSALISGKRSPELDENQDLYGWLIGTWDVSAIEYLDDQEPLRVEGEWHFTRILEGRAIQDVYIVPKRSLRTPFSSKTRNRYGTTIRYYDETIQAWRLNWFNPVSGASDQLIAKKLGNDIVQEGIDAVGNLMKWSFVDILPNSFHWKGERSFDGGKTYKLEAEFFGERNERA
jgi:hypothetical protein